MPTPLGPSARSIAAHVFDRVHGGGSFAAAVLSGALERHPELEARERALATELAYGALRTAPYVEARLMRHARRKAKLDALVRAHLVVAGYQVLFLERVPAFAAVSEAVEQIARARGAKVGAFANAILRRLSEEAAGTDKRAALETATRESVAPELRDALTRALGEGGARAFLEAMSAPPITLRVRVGGDLGATLAALRAADPGATFEPGRLSPLAIDARGASDPRRLPGYREGRLTIQEEGAQVAALALGTAPKDRVLDACAGRGNKTALLLELAGPGGSVDSADMHPRKLARLTDELERLGQAPRATFAVDWTVGAGDVPSGYDRVMVDAPCSGTGTLRRRPDLAVRYSSASIPGLAEQQARILVAAGERARPGGAVLYAVCSVLREEGEAVVERVVERARWLRPAPFAGEPARRLAGERHVLRLTPFEHGTDGYFLASFVRT